MFLHLVIVAALLSTGPHSGRIAGAATALVYRIPADAHALRFSARERSARPTHRHAMVTSTQPSPQDRFSLTTQLRR